MSEWAPNPRPFPYVFYGVQGNDMRAVESPSFLNHHEANVIADLITALLKRTDLAITTNDFGVICAYDGRVIVGPLVSFARTIGVLLSAHWCHLRVRRACYCLSQSSMAGGEGGG